MKRTKSPPKSNKSAKALKVHVVTYAANDMTEAYQDRLAADLAIRAHTEFAGMVPTLSTGYLIRADQLPAIVEAMAADLYESLWPDHSWERDVTHGQARMASNYVRSQFKAIGINAKEGGMSDDKIKEFLMIYGALQLIMLIPTFIGSWMGRREAKRRLKQPSAQPASAGGEEGK
jgi:hypothetical protein